MSSVWSRIQQGIPYLMYATAFVPVIVLNRFLFPYIAPRTALFRLVIELAVLGVLALAWRRTAQWQWRGNYVLYVFTAFVGVNAISTLFSFSPLLAWFSDYERMWGVFTLLHVWAFYVMVRMFFGGEEWRRFFNVTLAVSAFIALYGIAQYYPQLGIEVYQSGANRIIATLGNAAYVAIYTTFAMGIAAFMFIKARTWPWRAAYAAAFALNMYAFFLAGIRGTLLGIMVGVTIAGLLYILIGINKRAKAAVAVGIVVLASTAFFAMMNPNHALVQQNALLQRIASISLAGGTVETRLIGWNAAWQGFKERPVFGAGLENFNVIFNKYFDSDYYLIAPSEPYFDRSHNAWLDILALNGVVGFIVFLGFVAASGYYLYRGWRTETMSVGEVIIFTVVLTAYFIHLVFVFDDLTSYLYFIAVLAFLEYRVRRAPLVEWGEARFEASVGLTTALGALAIAVLFFAWQLNGKVLLAGNRVIDALRSPNIATAVERFHEALDYNIIPSRNVVLAYVTFLTERANDLSRVMQNPSAAEAIRSGIARAQEAMEQELEKDPKNALLYDRLAVLNTIGYLTTGKEAYANQSVLAAQQALELSPEHLRYHYTLADLYIVSGRPQEAVRELQEALSVNSQFVETYYQLAKAYVEAGEFEKAQQFLEIIVEKRYGASGERIFIILANQLDQAGEAEQSLEVLELAYSHLPSNVQVHSRLVVAYLQRDRAEDAITVLEHLGEVAPQLQSEVTYLISEIRAGRGERVVEQLVQD